MKHIIFDLNKTLIYKKYSYFEIFLQIINNSSSTYIFEKECGNFNEYISKKLNTESIEKLNLNNCSKNWISIFEDAIGMLNIDKQININLVAVEMYNRLGELSNWVLYDDVIETIEFLNKNNISYGFLSNWDDRMEKMWSKLSLKLAVHDSITVFSYRENYCKPDINIFKRYINLVNMKYENISNYIMFGDDLIADQGGKSLGIIFCHVERVDNKFNLLHKVKDFIL